MCALFRYEEQRASAAHGLTNGEKSTKPPLVSIFVPVYNRENYLPATLDSILAQTFTDFEVIIADDGSMDHTLEIAQTYTQKDTRIKVLSLPHRGEVATRNEAIQQAHPSSKYLMNHDSDDISMPDKLGKLVVYLESHPEIAIVGCLAEYFDDDGNHLGNRPIETQPDRIRATFGAKNSMINSASLIRREVFSKIGGYREEFLKLDDYDFFARALCAGFELANIPEVLHRIRLHPNSISRKYEPRITLLAEHIRADYTLNQLSPQAGQWECLKLRLMCNLRKLRAEARYTAVAVRVQLQRFTGKAK
jgi:glycosyltransferase involved in cell wall biosynthesis